jgi:hypothetical protein
MGDHVAHPRRARRRILIESIDGHDSCNPAHDLRRFSSAARLKGSRSIDTGSRAIDTGSRAIDTGSRAIDTGSRAAVDKCSEPQLEHHEAP